MPDSEPEKKPKRERKPKAEKAEAPKPAPETATPTADALAAARVDPLDPGVNWTKRLGDLILDAAKLATPGPRKMDRVVALVLDELGVPKALAGFIRSFAQLVYNEHRRTGRVR